MHVARQTHSVVQRCPPRDRIDYRVYEEVTVGGWASSADGGQCITQMGVPGKLHDAG